MRIGLDVGGTFTDAVLLDGSRVVASAKRRTTEPAVLTGVLAALDAILEHAQPGEIERITLSTTVITNTVVTEREEETDLYIVPGPGRNVTGDFPVKPIVIHGYTDHRGVCTAPLRVEDIPAGTSKKPAAVSAKFAVRNPKEEQALAAAVAKRGHTVISQGASLSGHLHFPRRTVSAYFNSAVYGTFQQFQREIEQAMADRHLTAPVYVLKADGGALPLAAMSESPVETVFTGPAASVLGIHALRAVPEGMAVAIDMGGTTTDISLWDQGHPLWARGGAWIREYPSAVRSFQVHSVGIGGETAITVTEDGQLQVGPKRYGPSVALGGSVLTLGDILLVHGDASYGNVEAAKEATAVLAATVKQSVPDFVDACIAKATKIVLEGIERAIRLENTKPVYVVQDMIDGKEFSPDVVVAVGGTAATLGHYIGEALGVETVVPAGAAVANAIGAGVAKDMIGLTVHVDTATKTVTVPELGIQASTSMKTLEAVKEYAVQLLEQEGERKGLALHEFDCMLAEYVPVIQGWYNQSALITVHMQGKAGVTTYVDTHETELGSRLFSSL